VSRNSNFQETRPTPITRAYFISGTSVSNRKRRGQWRYHLHGLTGRRVRRHGDRHHNFEWWHAPGDARRRRKQLPFAAGGALVIGGILSGFTVSSGLTLEASAGTVSNTTVLSGGTLELVARAKSGTTIHSGGTLEISAGETLSGYHVSGGVTVEALSNGKVSKINRSKGWFCGHRFWGHRRRIHSGISR
jgi:autotransporter passenger strand-loop-strand repeat protein